MQSRREVREATIQFLYCNDLEDGAPASQATEAFWELLLEDDFTKLTKASKKRASHRHYFSGAATVGTIVSCEEVARMKLPMSGAAATPLVCLAALVVLCGCLRCDAATVYYPRVTLNFGVSSRTWHLLDPFREGRCC